MVINSLQLILFVIIFVWAPLTALISHRTLVITQRLQPEILNEIDKAGYDDSNTSSRTKYLGYLLLRRYKRKAKGRVAIGFEVSFWMYVGYVLLMGALLVTFLDHNGVH